MLLTVTSSESVSVVPILSGFKRLSCIEPYPQKKKLSFSDCFCHSLTFNSKFSWSVLENFSFTASMYMWFRISFFFGWYLRDVEGGREVPWNSSFLTKIFTYLCISLTSRTPLLTNWCILLMIRSSTCCDIPPSYCKNRMIWLIVFLDDW